MIFLDNTHHFHPCTFSYLLLILTSAFNLNVQTLWRKFHPQKCVDQCWVVKKIIRKQGAKNPFQFFKQLQHNTFPSINFNIFLRIKIQSIFHKETVQLAQKNYHLNPHFKGFIFKYSHIEGCPLNSIKFSSMLCLG